MKKNLYKSIILSVAVLGLGAQITSLTTVKADEVAVESSESKSGESGDSKPSVVTEDNGAGNNEQKPQGEEESQSEDATTKSEVEKNDNLNQDDKEPKDEINQPAVDISSQQKANNRTNVPEEGRPFVEFEPRKTGLLNTDDPAMKGDLMIPYAYHGNGAVYVLDENNQPIVDDGSETGYKQNRFEDIYAEHDDILKVTPGFTSKVYGVLYSHMNPTNKKEELIKNLSTEGAFYLEFRNHGYDSLGDLNTYVNLFNKCLDELNELNDDGTQVVKNVTHHSSSSNHHTVTESNNITQAIDLTIITNKQATLFTEKGDQVTNRGLHNKTIWKADKVSIINNQLMYRISPTEWVAAGDVNLLK